MSKIPNKSEQRAEEIHETLTPDQIREFATRLTRRLVEGGERLVPGQSEPYILLAATHLAKRESQLRKKTPNAELVDRLFDAIEAFETGSWQGVGARGR